MSRAFVVVIDEVRNLQRPEKRLGDGVRACVGNASKVTKPGETVSDDDGVQSGDCKVIAQSDILVELQSGDSARQTKPFSISASGSYKVGQTLRLPADEAWKSFTVRAFKRHRLQKHALIGEAIVAEAQGPTTVTLVRKGQPRGEVRLTVLKSDLGHDSGASSALAEDKDVEASSADKVEAHERQSLLGCDRDASEEQVDVGLDVDTTKRLQSQKRTRKVMGRIVSNRLFTAGVLAVAVASLACFVVLVQRVRQHSVTNPLHEELELEGAPERGQIYADRKASALLQRGNPGAEQSVSEVLQRYPRRRRQECCMADAGSECTPGKDLPSCIAGMECVWKGEAFGPPMCEIVTRTPGAFVDGLDAPMVQQGLFGEGPPSPSGSTAGGESAREHSGVVEKDGNLIQTGLFGPQTFSDSVLPVDTLPSLNCPGQRWIVAIGNTATREEIQLDKLRVRQKLTPFAIGGIRTTFEEFISADLALARFNEPDLQHITHILYNRVCQDIMKSNGQWHAFKVIQRQFAAAASRKPGTTTDTVERSKRR